MRIVTTMGALAVSAVLMPAGLAQASVITYEFEAQVSLVVDPVARLGGAITQGMTFTGRYVLDSAQADSNADPGLGDYRFQAPPAGISMDVGGFTFASDPASLNMLIAIGNDRAT